MKRLLMSALNIILILAGSANASDPRKLTPIDPDPTASLRYAVSFIEAGLQRGELDAAVKRFSERYVENGIPITRGKIRGKMTRILQAKNQQVQSGEIKAGIYFQLHDFDISASRAVAQIQVYVYSPTENGNLKKLKSELIFEGAGSAWLLLSSDGLLERILQIYHDSAAGNGQDIGTESTEGGSER